MHNDCMGLYGNLTGKTSSFIEKIPTSFEVEKIQALKQTLVFMSKILEKIFKD